MTLRPLEVQLGQVNGLSLKNQRSMANFDRWNQGASQETVVAETITSEKMAAQRAFGVAVPDTSYH